VPAINWYLTATTADGWRNIDEATQAAAKNTDGWVVSTGATNHAEYAVGVERAASTFVNTTPPSGTLNTSLKDAFRTTDAYNGDFASANWTFVFSVRATTNGGAQDGRIRFRLIKANADGSSATEITSAQQQASLLSNVATTGTFESSLTFNPGAFSLANQYLFVQIAWERTGAGGMANSDINWITGSSASVGTRITSSDFTSGAQALTQATRFDNSNTFYSPTVAAGTVTLTQPSRFDNSQTFYGPTVTASVTLTQSSRFDNAQTFYGPTATPGAVTLTPSRFDNVQTFYAATVTLSGSAQTLLPSLFANANTFYSPTVAAGTVTLTPVRFDNTQAFYSPTVTPGAAALAPARFDNTNTFYSPTVSAGAVTLQSGLFSNTNTFYAPTVTTGAVTLTPARFDNTQTFYSPTVTLAGGTQNLAPPLLTNSQTFFAPTVTPGAVMLTPGLFANTNTFFAATVTPRNTLQPPRLDNTNTFFAPTVTQASAPAQVLTPGLFTNTNTFYSPSVEQSQYLITLAQAKLLFRMYLLHGLASPLVVGPTSRQAGDIEQSITAAGDAVTISTLAQPDYLDFDPGLMVEELAALHGLTVDLVVTPVTRTAGSIVQDMVLAGGVTTVTRQ